MRSLSLTVAVLCALVVAGLPPSPASAAGAGDLRAKPSPSTAGERFSFSDAEARMVAGPWDISTGNGAFRCRILLNLPGPGRQNALVGIPDACRHAMPALVNAMVWSLARDGTLHLARSGGPELVALKPRSPSGFEATASGADYRLVPAERTASEEARLDEMLRRVGNKAR